MTIDSLTKLLEDRIQATTTDNVHELAGLFAVLEIIKGKSNDD